MFCFVLRLKITPVDWIRTARLSLDKPKQPMLSTSSQSALDSSALNTPFRTNQKTMCKMLIWVCLHKLNTFKNKDTPIV